MKERTKLNKKLRRKGKSKKPDKGTEENVVSLYNKGNF